MLTHLSLTEAHKKLKDKEISSVELTTAYLDQIKRNNEILNVYVHVDEKGALKQAKEVDEKGDFSQALTGIPCSLKDNFCSTESPSQSGSHILDEFTAPYDATCVARMKEQGVVILGKTNTDEFTMGASTETSYFGPTHNPWDASCVAGGSSGGPASATAGEMNVFSLGSDTGGSIRQPAAFCGCVGFKPTYGRVSRFGVMPMASCFDTVGTLTKTVEDAALVMNTIAGEDSNDMTSIKDPVADYGAKLGQDIKGMKIGLPKEYFVDGIEEGVEQNVRDAIEVLKSLGAEIQEISLPHTKYSLAVYHTIGPLDISANMARYDGIRYGLSVDNDTDLIDYYKKVRNQGFGEEVKMRISIGRLIDEIGYADKYYQKARQVQALMKQDFEKAFEQVDIIVAPTAPMVAFKIGERMSSDPLTMYLSDSLVAPCSLTAMPAISVPCGFSSNLPVGLQIIGKHFDEETVLRVAHNYEQATEWHKQRPNL